MKFAKVVFTVSFSIFLLLGLLSRAMSQKKAPGTTVITYGIEEDANTYIPPPQIQRRPTQRRGIRSVQSQFPDANLAAALRTALSLQTDDPIFPEDMETLATFSASNQSIETLTGLEQATGLTDLDLSDNAIVDLGPLRNLTSLEELDLADNQIENVSPLSNLTSLTSLDLDDNEIEDVSALLRLTSLRTLVLRDYDL